MNRILVRTVLIAALLSLASLFALAQDKGTKESLACRDNWYSERLVGHCGVREQTFATTGGVFSIDGRHNGGVCVRGWDQNQILVRARVPTGATTAGDAEGLAKQITTERGG